MFFILIFSPKISSALDFEEIGVLSGRFSASHPSIAVNPLNGEVCVAYQDRGSGVYKDIRVKCLRDGIWQDLGSPIRYGVYGDLQIDETGYYLAVWDYITWWRGAIRVFKFGGNDWVQIGHLSRFRDDEHHPSRFSLTIHNGNPVVAFWGVKVPHINIYVYMYEDGGWNELRAEEVTTSKYSLPPYWWRSPSSIGVVSDSGNIYLMWDMLVDGNGDALYVERFDGFKWEVLEGKFWAGRIGRDYPFVRNASISMNKDGFPAILYVEDVYWPYRVYMDIWDGNHWVEVDGLVSDENIFSVEVPSHTKAVVFTPEGELFAGFLQVYASSNSHTKTVLKRYDPSNRIWVKEYESSPYVHFRVSSPSLAYHGGYIYIAEGGAKPGYPLPPSLIYIKRAVLPLGRAQFEKCFSRVVSSKDAIEELVNRDCLVENMIFYNGFLYDVLKDPSRTLRERVFAGAYLFEFPQYLNEERISYLNSFEFVSLLNEALFQEEDEYIKEKAMFCLVREENEYAKSIITGVLSDETRIGLFYILKRHSTGSKSRWLGELFFDLAFFHPYPYTRWNAKRILSMVGTYAVPFDGFINILSGNYTLDMKAEVLQSLYEVLLHRKKIEISENIREALGDCILSLKNYPELRGYVLKVLSALGGYWDYLINELKAGDYTPDILPAMSIAIDFTTADEFYQKIDELVDIALNPELEDWRRIYAAKAGFQTVIRNVEPMALIPLWDVYPYAVSLIFDESVPAFVKTEALTFSTSVTDEVSRSDLLISVISSTTDYTILSEAIRLGGALADCSFATSLTEVKNDYSSEISFIGFYKEKIEKEVLKLEEKLKRKLSINEDCPKGCKGKDCRNCVGIAGKVDEILKKLDEAKRHVSEPSILNLIEKFRGEAIDFKERVLVGYSYISENGYISLNPSNYRNEINRLKSFVLSLRDELYHIMKIVSNEDALDKLNEVEEKLSEIDEKIDDMYGAISEAEEEVKEILEDSSYSSVSDMTYRENVLSSLSMQINVATSTLMERCNPPTVKTQEHKGSEGESIEKEGNPDDPDPVVSGYVLNQDGEKLKDVTIKFEAEAQCLEWDIPECVDITGVEFWEALWNLWQPRTIIGKIIKIVFFWWVKLLATYICHQHCINYVPGVTYYATTNELGTYSVEVSPNKSYHVYLEATTYPYLATGTKIGTVSVFGSNRTVHLVIPFAEVTTQCADSDGDHINDCAETLLANNHNPFFNFDQESGERYFPRHPRLYYNCAEYIGGEGCNVDQSGKIKCGNETYSPPYEAIYSTIGSGENCEINNTDNKIRIMRTSGHVYYRVRKPNENTFHIQYFLFFDYNDTEGLVGVNDHYADWEWGCVYTNAKAGVYSHTYPEDLGKIWKLHYHRHGGTPSDTEGCERWSDISFTRGTGEWNENNRCTIDNIELPIDYCYIYEPNKVPEHPRIWVGDDVHGFWDGYPEVPREACSSLGGVERVDNYPAKFPDGSTVNIFPFLISIDPSSFPYDETVHRYMGKWGEDDKSPVGPCGPSKDRDCNGEFDEY